MYGTKKCADILFQTPGDRTGKAINKGKLMLRIRKEMKKRLENLVYLEVYHKNFMKIINCIVLPVAGYAMNVCQFTQKELYDLDMLVKEIQCRIDCFFKPNKLIHVSLPCLSNIFKGFYFLTASHVSL